MEFITSKFLGKRDFKENRAHIVKEPNEQQRKKKK